jgi:hypothetical protein
MFVPVSIDHPAGTVKVAPPGVTRGVSAATVSAAVAAACPLTVIVPAAIADEAPDAETHVAISASAQSASRVVRMIDIESIPDDEVKKRHQDTPGSLACKILVLIYN